MSYLYSVFIIELKINIHWFEPVSQAQGLAFRYLFPILIYGTNLKHMTLVGQIAVASPKLELETFSVLD